MSFLSHSIISFNYRSAYIIISLRCRILLDRLYLFTVYALRCFKAFRNLQTYLGICIAAFTDFTRFSILYHYNKGHCLPQANLHPILRPARVIRASPCTHAVVKCGWEPLSSKNNRWCLSPRTLRGLSATIPIISQNLPYSLPSLSTLLARL